MSSVFSAADHLHAAPHQSRHRRRCCTATAAPTLAGRHSQLLHALVLSFPTQGHITPLLQLSRRLALSKLFLVTFVVTDHTSSRSPRSPAAAPHRIFPTTPEEHANDELSARISMVSVPDGLPLHHPRDRSFSDQEQSMNGMRHPVELLLHSLQAGSSSSASAAVDCIISDIFVTWSSDVAGAFQLPLVAFYTANATSGCVLYHTRLLISKGILPFQDENSSAAIDCIPGVLPLRPKEFPPSMQSSAMTMPRFQFTLRMFEHIHDCVGLLLNTLYEMEAKAIDALREQLPAVFPVGPLFLPTTAEEPLPTESEMPFWEEDDCMAWLDSQGAATVLYVSFGSVTTYSEEQFRELAEGLEESKLPFLWVVRRDALGQALGRALPDGYMERVKGRGTIVSWAPQLRVLAHPAVGGFLTHCGWNSILESVSIGGVPMLCWPDMADQMVNRRLLVEEWKIGLAFAQDSGREMVGRHEVACVIRQLLLTEEGRACRERAGEWQRLLREAVQEGGSSSANLARFLGSFEGEMIHCQHV